MAVQPKVRVLVKHIYPPEQTAALLKARKFGWVQSPDKVINPDLPGQVAVVITMHGTTAIVYPDGETHRQSGQKDGRLYFRDGWYDPVARQKRIEREARLKLAHEARDKAQADAEADELN